ncbi:MAG: hypothetical protein PVF37_10940 [Desulfobacterales bacterium]|jgi:hypothetical protein
MEEEFKINHSIARLTSAKRVKSIGHRQNGRQQNGSKESFQKKKKKKSDKTENMDRSLRLNRKPTTANNFRKNNAVKTTVKNSSNRNIDITV